MQLRSPQARQRYVEVTIAHEEVRRCDIMIHKDFFAWITAENLRSLRMDRMVIDEHLARSTSVVKLPKGIDLAPGRWMDVLRKDLRGEPPGPEFLLECRGHLA